MTSYKVPTTGELRAAFDAHGVRYVVEKVVARAEGRAWARGLRAIVNHHTAGRSSLKLLLNEGGELPIVNTLIDRDGLVHVLSWKSCWGSGDGGPWPGVAERNELHYVAWQNEVEDLGQGKTFAPEQLESLGRVNAALVSLGVPAGNEINHRDWTDGTGPVPGPLPTRGRKVDTRYSTEELQANTARYRLEKPKPAPVKPAPKPAVKPADRDGVVRIKVLTQGVRAEDVREYQRALRRFAARRGINVRALNPNGATGFYGKETAALTRAVYRELGWTQGDLTVPGPKLLEKLELKVKG